MSVYIIRYKKTGDLKYISHLDLLRCVQRILRRAELPLKYSEGFNPHPHLVFALPLSVGYEGYSELFEIRLLEDLSEKEVFDKLSAVNVTGFGVIEVKKAEKNEFAKIDRAVYRIEPENMPDQKAIDEFLAKSEILCEKKTKKGMKTENIRDKVFSLCLKDGYIEAVLAAGNSANLKPSVLADILGMGFCRYARVCFCDGERII